jgi:hypothetical protein
VLDHEKTEGIWQLDGAGHVKRGRVEGFAPSASGFRFPNKFPPRPVLAMGVGRRRLGIGNAANGLCGGMVFAARDLFEAGIAPPAATEPPAGRSPLFRFVVRRLFHSFDLPAGPARYMTWMVLPSGEGRLGLRGVAARTVGREWPLIKGDLDRGVLSPIGLVRVHSFNPLELGRNHQVLAYGYELDERSDRVAINVYDPNHPGDDEVALSFSLKPGPGWEVGYVAGELPVRGFFRTRFRPVDRGSLARLRMIVGFDRSDAR